MNNPKSFYCCRSSTFQCFQFDYSNPLLHFSGQLNIDEFGLSKKLQLYSLLIKPLKIVSYEYFISYAIGLMLISSWRTIQTFILQLLNSSLYARYNTYWSCIFLPSLFPVKNGSRPRQRSNKLFHQNLISTVFDWQYITCWTVNSRRNYQS